MKKFVAGALSILLIASTQVSTASADVPRLSTASSAIKTCKSAAEMECLERFDVIYPGGKVAPAQLIKESKGSYTDSNNQSVDYNLSGWKIVDVDGSSRNITMTAYILPEMHVNPAYKRYTPTMWIGIGDLTLEDTSSGIKFKIAVRSSWLKPQGAGMYGKNAQMLDDQIPGGRRYTFIGSPAVSASISDPAVFANLDTAKSERETPVFYFLIDHWSSIPGGSFYNDACADKGYHFGSSNAIVGGEPYMSDKETLKFNIGSAHLLSTGEINTGFFTATYPVKYLDCRWPGNTLTSSPRIEVSILNADGSTQIATTTVQITNGLFKISAYGFHYSQPTVMVRATTDTSVPLVNQEEAPKTTVVKKITITCSKGKLVKKVTAVKPVCPKGYKKK